MLPERKAPRPLSVLPGAFAELFVSLGPDSLVAGTVEPGKLNLGIMIFRRGGERTVMFDPEEPVALRLSVKAAALGFDLQLPSDCTRVFLAVDDEPGKIGGSPRFDDCVGRCFVSSEVVFGGASAVTRGSACDGRGVSAVRSEEGCVGPFF